jgi:stage II sporulation protein D
MSALILLLLGWLISILMYSKVECPLAFAESDRPGDAFAADVQIGVLGLFHTHQFTVRAPAGNALLLRAGDEGFVLERSSGLDSASVSISGSGLLLVAGKRVVRASRLVVSGRNSEPVDFVLAVPNRITRHYRGTLEIRSSKGNLIAIVVMDRETAVASVVAAESAPDTPLEALKAQAVAARSYFVANRGRHHDFDFCDTTHCQFLREPPPPGIATRAVADTRSLVLAYNSHPFAAMYTRSCSGHTRTPAELGLPSATYPYYSVECKYCRAHPARWTSRISAQDASMLRSSDESARLKIDRTLGWGVVPSNDFTVRREDDRVILEGTGQGHGIGLCQAGAKAMAEEGANFRQILNHYYPNTRLVIWPGDQAPARRPSVPLAVIR